MKRLLCAVLFVVCSIAHGQHINPNSQIAWPSGCNAPNYVYSYYLKACVLAGSGGGGTLAGDANGPLLSNTVGSVHFGTNLFTFDPANPPSSSLPYVGWTSAGILGALAAPSAPVTQLIAGTNITLSPTSGLGNVTISASGGGSGCGTGSCVVTNPSGGQVIAQTTSTTMAVNNLNNYFLASQYQTGGGNNGIANVAALNSSSLTGIADPGYGSTETVPGNFGSAYGISSLAGSQPGWPTLTAINDDRGGQHHYITTLGGTAQFPVTPQWGEYYYNDYDVTGATLAMENSVETSIYNGLGQQINGFGGVNLKTYWSGAIFNYGSAAQGQHLGVTSNMLVEGIGDVVGQSNTIICDGGQSTYNDVGCHEKENTTEGDHVIPTGTISSVLGSYALQVNLGATVGHEGDGRFLIDQTADVISGSGYPTQYFSNNFSFPPSSVTPWGQNGQVPPDAAFVGTSFTPSILVMVCTTAFGGSCPNNSSTNPSGQIQSASGGYAPGTLTVPLVTAAPGLPTAYQITTSGFSTNSASPNVVCVADSQYFETTTAYASDSTHLVINFTKPHFNGATVSLGGTPGCQYGFENTGQTFQYNGTGQKYMQVWPVLGALDATDLLVWDHNSQQNWSRALTQNNSAGYCQTDPIAIASVVGNVVTFVDTQTSAPLNPHFVNSNLVISTANSSYNGTWAVSGVSIYYSGKSNWPAYQYTASSISGVNPGTGTATFCNQNYNFYPMIEVKDVRNPSTNQVDGYFQLAAYNLAGAFASGDTVAEPHYFWQYINASVAGDGIFQQLPQPAYVGVTTNGYNYGDSRSGNFVGFDINNVSNQALYQGYASVGGGGNQAGGLVAPQSAYQVTGPWRSALTMAQPPNSPGVGDGAVISITNCKPSPIGCANPTYSPFTIYQGPATSDTIYDNPYTNSIVFGNSIGIGGGGGGLSLSPFIMSLYSPIYGTTASSLDQGNTLTPDGRFEGSGYQFYSSTYAPPTNYQPLNLYADGSASIGMIFLPTSSATPYNAGNLDLGSLQFYVPSTTTALKTAGISVNSTIGQISFDDATPGDAGASGFMKNLTLSGTMTTPAITLNGATITHGATVADVSVTIPSFSIPANTCYGSSGSTTPQTVTMTGVTSSPQMAILPSFTGNSSAINGWGATGGLSLQAWASAANQASYVVCNSTASPITGGSITLILAAK